MYLDKLDWEVKDPAGHIHEAETRFGSFKVYRHPDAPRLLVAHFLDKAFQCRTIKHGKEMMQHVYNVLVQKASEVAITDKVC